MRPPTIALIAIGGAIGGVARYELAVELPVRAGRFPYTTFGINVGGALMLGFLLEWLVRHRPRDEMLRPLLGIGMLGAFTTFSTVCTETVLLVRDGHIATASLYVLLTVAVGLGAVVVGLRGAGWNPRAPVPETGEE